MISKLEVFTKRDTTSELSGSYLSFFKGRGYDFEGYREYTFHDDSRDIDWKASLRSKKMLIKIMREERNLRVFFLFDVSDTMLFASTDKLKCEYAAELIASLGFAILRAGDSVGMMMFSDDIINILPAKSGVRHYYELTKSLSNPKFYGGKFNLARALKFANGYIPRNSIVILVSDLIGLDNSWMTHFKVSTKKFDFLLAIMVRDPVDNFLPKDTGQAVTEDPFSSSKLIIDPDLISKEYEASSRKIKENIKREFSRVKCEILELLTDKPYDKLLLKFFIKSKRKWR